jgi:hypothetical protein
MRAILAAVDGTARSAAAVVAHLAAVHDIEAEDDLDATVAARLAELDALGLVRRLS